MRTADWRIQKERVIPLRQAGHSLDDITRMTGFSLKTVMKQLRAAGVPAPSLGVPRFSEPCRVIVPGEAPSPELAVRLARDTVGRMNIPLMGDFDRDDLESAAVLRVLKQYPQFDPDRGASFRSYIISHARWAIKEELRVLGRRNGSSRSDRAASAPYFAWVSLSELDQGEHPDDPDQPKQGEPYTVPPVEQWVTRAAIESGMRTLPAHLREVVRRRLRGETFGAIGQAMGVSETRINQRYREAVAKLRVALGIDPAPVSWAERVP